MGGERDPIERVRALPRTSADFGPTREEQELIEPRSNARFREAVAIAERTPPPRLESMFDDVYESRPWHLAEQRAAAAHGAARTVLARLASRSPRELPCRR